MTDKTDEKENPSSLPETPPERPNEGLALSTARDDGEGPAFYYSRSRRLARASAKVRALYEEQEKPKFNLLRPLLSSKPNAILFGTLMALVLIMLAVNISRRWGGAQDYYGNRLSLSAVRYEGTVVLTLRKTRREGAAYTGPVDIAVSPLEGAGQEYPHRISFSSRSPEEFSFSIPFEGSGFAVRISHEGAGEGGSLAFRVKTK
ncbi:MAG: hypothetical protein LBU00_05880 [Treponema sp.]|jgi:hypothetical protein|nr:hypothetical protein [Treponema sp.]